MIMRNSYLTRKIKSRALSCFWAIFCVDLDIFDESGGPQFSATIPSNYWDQLQRDYMPYYNNGTK